MAHNVIWFLLIITGLILVLWVGSMIYSSILKTQATAQGTAAGTAVGTGLSVLFTDLGLGSDDSGD